MAFEFSTFVEDLPPSVQAVLNEEKITSKASLLALDIQDIESLDIKRGPMAILRRKVMALQDSQGVGPLTVKDCVGQDPVRQRPLDQLLQSSMPANQPGSNIHEGAGSSRCLRIVDFVPTSQTVEEEVTLAGGVTLKLNSKPKLEKVTPAAWITANARILQQLMNEDQDTDVNAYLAYTEMVGELAARYTWASVMVFDDEYRQRQARLGFQWGTEAPHLSTVVLRERQQQQPMTQHQHKAGRRPPRTVGPPGRELCRQFNSGACGYGSSCQFQHACHTCGGDHPGRDHAAGTSAAPTTTPGPGYQPSINL
jgi:hypothetical protein